MPNFKTSLEKATSQLLLEPDWDSVLQIVDSIRQGDVQPKAALFAIKKKVGHENPHVAMFALQVLEACVKNCGSPLHVEVASKEFMEFLKDQVKSRADPVKEKILELIQTWSHAFRNEASYKVVEDTFHLLKMEGYKFPALKEADAMFDSERAPSWKDGETCTRCRVQFGVVQRKHHCRNCGEVFCGKCSTKTSIIPKLGFEREVRVCDSCFEKINKMGAGGKKEDDLPAEYLASPLSKQPQAGSSTALPAHRLSLEDSRKSGHSQVLKGMPPSKQDQEQQEEEELMLALALSKSEHESKEKERERLRVNYGMNQKVSTERAPSPVKPSVLAGPLDTSDMDPELARYLNRHYWQQKVDENKSQQPPPLSSTVPSAPAVSGEPRNVSGQQQGPPTASPVLYQNGDTEDSQEQFLSALRGSLEIFINRMRSNSQRGRPIANDSAVQSLFAVISDMHPQLMSHIQEKEDARSYYEGLQDKLTQLRDAREALDSLREEHREKRRREAEEMERQRQIQMMQKLEIMRQKKHEYLEMQRQLALQRLQEQEREMAARFEQQKQLTHIRQMQAFGYQQGYPQNMAPMHGVLPGGGPLPSMAYTQQAGNSVDGSPVHRMANDNYGMMQQGLGHMGPPLSTYSNQGQPGLYNLGQQPLGGQYSMGHMAVGGFQADGQGMVGQQGYLMNEAGPASLPVQHSGAHSGGYNGLLVQMSSTGLPYPHGPALDNQQGYPGPAAQVQEHQSFNMQGVAHALPTQPNSVGYNNQVVQHQPTNQPNSVGYNSQVAQHQPVHQPNSGGYNSQVAQHQAPYQPQPMGQYQPGVDIPTSQQEAPLISFD